MILFQLNCHDEHTFEAWFRNGESFNDQVRDGHVECPYCGSTQIQKTAAAAEAIDLINENSSDTRAYEVAQRILDAVSKPNDDQRDD